LQFPDLIVMHGACLLIPGQRITLVLMRSGGVPVEVVMVLVPPWGYV
jgi:hypothetical protein